MLQRYRFRVSVPVRCADHIRLAAFSAGGVFVAVKTAGGNGEALEVSGSVQAEQIAELFAVLFGHFVMFTEVGRILGVSRQRANTLSQTEPDFPKPARPGPRALYSRASIEAFDKRWKATRNPRGGPRPRKGPAQIVQQMQGKPTQVAQPMSGDDHTTTDR